uniref:Polymerase nucleotidyl transferase domain-containing protein n=1 Tax=Fervidicoccus fontis TaxID=683846 RepID=A0A7J3ZIZ8_9CREN
MVEAIEGRKPRCYVEGCMVKLGGVAWIIRGLAHPEGHVLALPRYVVKGNSIVRKVKIPSLSELESIELARGLVKYARCYGRLVPLIPRREIDERAEILHPLFPRECSDRSESIACMVLKELRRESGIETIGLTGSNLLAMPGSHADVDLVVYGRRECTELYEFLAENRFLEPYSKSELLQLLYSEARFFDKRLLEVEQKKVLQGKRLGARVYIRLVPSYPEEYRVCACEVLKIGEIALRGRVVSDDSRYVYPCGYDVEIEVSTESRKLSEATRLKVVSDRGRFCELARTGDRVLVRGELELVVSNNKTYLQVYLWRGSHHILLV